MASTADIRKGLCIRFNNDVYKIVEFLHVKPGKGPAFVRTKLKSLTNGRVLDNTFSAGHKIEEVRVESHNYQYLYKDESGFHFMNTQDYHQVQLPKEFLSGDRFLKEGLEVTISFQQEDETPLNLGMPASVILEVTYTEPGIKGDTATNTTKPATLETGAVIQVPLFINAGERIKVNTEDGSYIERAK
ncbi:elongation factor P [Bacteroidetes bacterium endosymbiont of Geopemphigus sp.]|uniref:elongation factor P n=1 Tax=Bacteroidetes bacterium endosymbiont of Geopemphigus sp. TaxID=2047937 RepID=UPI000CCFEA2D|nr:elongation factor P [Bacteroidetes bacterium endosymbiont of Geopemphigus sp.]